MATADPLRPRHPTQRLRQEYLMQPGTDSGLPVGPAATHGRCVNRMHHLRSAGRRSATTTRRPSSGRSSHFPLL